MRKASVLAALLLLAPATSEAKTLEELLIEKGVITRGEAAGTVSNSPAKVYYNEGTRIDFPDAGFTLRIRTMLQARYTFSDEDESFEADERHAPADFNGVNGTRVNTSSFDIVRARIVVEGTALYQEFAYKLEGDFVGTANDNDLYFPRGDQVDGRKEPNLKDAYIVWQPCEGYGTQVGQFRTHISRQFRTNDPYLQFADRSVVSGFNQLGWQQGVAQNASFSDGMVEASVGAFNGLSDFEGNNMTGLDTDHTVIGSFRVNPAGPIDPYQEGDIDYSEEMGVSLGTAYAYSEAHSDVGLGRQEDWVQHNVSADANVKYMGVSLHGEYFYKNAELQHRTAGLDFSTNGGYVQAGFFLEPRTVELAARYGYQDCDDGKALGVCAGRDKIDEWAATINYYWWKHALKAQFGYAYVNENFVGGAGIGGQRDANTNRWIFQLSSYF
jgi:phosphate-selective porin OprO and OprP